MKALYYSSSFKMARLVSMWTKTSMLRVVPGWRTPPPNTLTQADRMEGIFAKESPSWRGCKSVPDFAITLESTVRYQKELPVSNWTGDSTTVLVPKCMFHGFRCCPHMRRSTKPDPYHHVYLQRVPVQLRFMPELFLK